MNVLSGKGSAGPPERGMFVVAAQSGWWGEGAGEEEERQRHCGEGRDGPGAERGELG